METERFQHPSEAGLHAAMQGQDKMRLHMQGGRYEQAMDVLVELKPAIDAFFEAVMVNAEDRAVRSNRLSLLKEVDDFFMSFADFSQIVVQGS